MSIHTVSDDWNGIDLVLTCLFYLRVVKVKVQDFQIRQNQIPTQFIPGPPYTFRSCPLGKIMSIHTVSDDWNGIDLVLTCLFYLEGVKVRPNPSKKRNSKPSYSAIFHTRLFIFWLKALYPPMTKCVGAIWPRVKLTIDLRWVKVFPHQQIVLLTTPISAMGLQIIPFLLWFLVQLGHIYQPGKF